MAAELFTIFLAAVFTENILLARFLGMCSFLGVSGQLKTAAGLGAAVVFVLSCTSVLNWLVYHYALAPCGLDYLRYISFIIMIAAFVQFVEIVVERVSPVLYFSLGIFLPLITVNCAILGVSLFMLNKETTQASLINTFFYGAGSGVGWMLAIVAMAGIREKLQKARIPKGLEGPGITLIVAGIMALAFIGLAGVLVAE